MIDYFKVLIDFSGTFVGWIVGVLSAVATLAGAANYLYSKFKKLTGEKIDLEKRTSSLENSLRIQIEENIRLKNRLSKEEGDLKIFQTILPYDHESLHDVYHMLDACAYFMGRGKIKHASAHIMDRQKAKFDAIRFLRDSSFLIARRKLILKKEYGCARQLVASDCLLSLLDAIDSRTGIKDPVSEKIDQRNSRIDFDLGEVEYLYQELKNFWNYSAIDSLLAAIILENTYFRNTKESIIYSHTRAWIIREINMLRARLVSNPQWYLFLPNTIVSIYLSNKSGEDFGEEFDFSKEHSAIVCRYRGQKAGVPQVLYWIMRDELPKEIEIFSMSSKIDFLFKMDRIEVLKPEELKFMQGGESHFL